MRDLGGTKTVVKKKPKQSFERTPGRAPKQLPPLSPKGFATDVTPKGKKVSPEGRGAAMLMRGSFETYLSHQDDKLGIGQRRTIKMLREAPEQFLDPRNAHHLSSLTKPSPELKKAIAKDPHLTQMHKAVLDATVFKAPERQLPAVDSQASNPQGQAPAPQGMVRNPTTGALYPSGKYGAAANAWGEKFAGGALDAIVGTAPFVYHMATTDPRQSLPEVGGALKHSFGETLTHPIRQLKNDPFSFFSNVTAPIGGGVGVSGRVGSLTRAVAGREAGSSAIRAAAHGFTHPEVRSLIDLYESKSPGAQARIAKENDQIAEDIVTAMETNISRPTTKKGRVKLTWEQAKQQVRETRALDKQRPRDIMDTSRGMTGPIAANVSSQLYATVRELTDGVRAGTIYLRPAYLPNNWAGNTFMSLVHQGFLAPVNLAKSVYMHRKLNARELRGIRAATGQTAAQAVQGTGRGYVRAFTDPVAHQMGRLADQPFRDASFLHEARRKGYHSIDDVKQLIRRADNGDQSALREMANIGRKAQEEIVKFKKLNTAEQSVARNVFFVYNWMKGAARYAARFPLQHPIQTSVLNAGAQIGNADVRSKIGGLPPYLVGNIPVGHGKLSNPFALNPLGTAVQIGRATQGTAKELFPGQFGQFDKHTMEDWTSLINPVFGGAIEARDQTGGRGYVQNIVRNIAPYRLYQGLAHPGSGSTFPGTRMEALGHYVFGSLYPRRYDPAAIQQALERMNINHPEALIADSIKKYEAKTGEKVPADLVAAYRKDLHELKAQKDFKTSYAHSHNSSSYRKLPAVNKAQAAIDYLDQHHIVGKEEIAQFKDVLNQLPNDSSANDLANSLWSITAVGAAKRAWNELMKTTKQDELTRSK